MENGQKLKHLGRDFQLAWGWVRADDTATNSNEPHKRSSSSLKRKREFQAGRCAAESALKHLGAGGVTVGVLPSGAPQWPQGVTGSISHSGSWALAVAGFKKNLPLVGLDLQSLIPSARSLQVLERITNPQERGLLSPLDETTRGTWVFSAKEACFKALSPLNLDPPCTRITSVQLTQLTTGPELAEGVFTYSTTTGPVLLKVRWAFWTQKELLTLALPFSTGKAVQT